MLSWIARAICSLISRVSGSRATWRPNIPTEVLSNILSRLPAASLQRFKSVSKEWLEIISDPYLAELHLANQPLEFELIYSFNMVKSFFLESPEENCFKKRKIPAKIIVYDTFKGLVLFGKVNGMHIVNPITGYTLNLPPFSQYDHSVVKASIGPLVYARIGYDSCLKKYKVIIVHWTKCHIITLQEQGCSAWRELDMPPLISMMANCSPIFVEGCLHWINPTGIISLDVNLEKFFERTELPRSPLLDDIAPRFLEWDGCVAVIPKYQWEPSYCIFILRDSMWTELELDVTFFEHLCPSEEFGETPPYPIASLKNGQLIIFKKLGHKKIRPRIPDDECFFAYHLQEQVMTPFLAVAPQGEEIFRMNGYFWNGSIMPHVNSLISC